MPLIVLEGLDGAGKTTQVKLLQDMLARRGGRYEYIHFPRFGAPVYGDMIARFLRGEFGELDSVDPYIVALLFAGDRADAGPMMEVWLREGKFVILDRYVNSNIAFQCAKCGDPARRHELKKWILDTEFVQFGIPRPDMSLFLDVPFEFTSSKLSGPRSGEDREYLQGGRDIHEESLDFQRKVREMYLEIAHEDDKMHVIDCSDDKGGMARPEEIFARIGLKVAALVDLF
jgi:dTMP kinase